MSAEPESGPFHDCYWRPESEGQPLILRCFEREDDATGELQLWVTDGEHESRVNVCPFCGYEADATYPIEA